MFLKPGTDTDTDSICTALRDNSTIVNVAPIRRESSHGSGCQVWKFSRPAASAQAMDCVHSSLVRPAGATLRIDALLSLARRFLERHRFDKRAGKRRRRERWIAWGVSPSNGRQKTKSRGAATDAVVSGFSCRPSGAHHLFRALYLGLTPQAKYLSPLRGSCMQGCHVLN